MSAPDPWTEGMLIQIARDIELIKATLGVDRDADGAIVRVLPPGSTDARDIATNVMGHRIICPACDTDTHRCPGCGTPLIHGVFACDGCLNDNSAERAPEDDWLN